MADRHLLYAAAFLRATATGAMGVLLGLTLARAGLGGSAIGAVVTAGLAGAATAALVAALAADRIGRRRFLVGLALLSAAGTVALAFTDSALVAGAAAFAGMLNGMGR